MVRSSLATQVSLYADVRSGNSIVLTRYISGQPYYDGSSFASYEDVIVVSANYRTNGQ